ncbi:MAG: hypothetical protein EBX37_10900 [Alphaproteobacteria bacterium]|nr:hypothetical protein [Alphaproteobacteria bacterium]
MTLARLTTGLSWLCAAFSLWYILCFLGVALPSLYYPFALEWIEVQSVDTIARAYGGQPIYTAPTLEYVPLLYTPLYYHVAAIAAHLTGMDFIAGRLVSLLSALGVLALLYRWARREGAHRAQALTAAGLFAATYHIGGRWFDLARVDSLALLLLIAGLYVLRFGQKMPAAALAGAWLAASFFTKQLALGVALPMLALTMLQRRRYGLVALASCLAVLAAGMAWLEWASGGWFSFFCFKVAAGHSIDDEKILGFWQRDVLMQQGFALAAALLGLGTGLRQRTPLVYYGGFLATLLAAVYAARLHRYGYINNLMPLHAGLALLAALALAQLAALAYDPRPLVPTQQSVLLGNKFLKEIAAQEGDVFMGDVPFLSQRVGKKSYSYSMGAYDLFRARLQGADEEVKNQLGRDMEAAIAQRKFGVIIPGRLVHNALPGLNNYYKIAKKLDYPEGYALDSLKIRPMVLYVPNQPKPLTPP